MKPELSLFFYFIDKNSGYFSDILTAKLQMSQIFISESWSPYSRPTHQMQILFKPNTVT